MTTEQLLQLSRPSTTATSPALTKMLDNAYSTFASPPSGAAVPLPPANNQHTRKRSGSLGERRGYQYTIVLEGTKPFGPVIVAKGALEPRKGALPRRRTRKRVPNHASIAENKGFDLLIDSSSTCGTSTSLPDNDG
ncbi:hypothetical protein Moror_4694 [Moniliophthora roreri MCA 2997]|uniref:Uncharacterized protein n=1 Tax=Moniliophthora roreri (strain MCA 2997) TaxID=1381753 RepID=V2XHI4_MONRO|nr:hypothetical protein Moror_4694 [Moniliophthora roreri MCA 2997]